MPLSSVTLAILALFSQSSPRGPIISRPSTATAAPSAPVYTPTALFEFMMAGSSDQSAVADLCDTYAADMTGNYFCLRADGTSTGLVASAVGSPVTDTRSYCGNGMDCGNVTMKRFPTTSDYYQSTAVASPTGSFTACGVVKFDNSTEGGSVRRIISKLVGGTTLTLYAGSTAYVGIVTKAGGTSTTVTSAASSVLARIRQFVCVRYTYVADGSSLQAMFVDGVASGTPSAVAVGPPAPFNTVYTVGGTAVLVSGFIGNAFITESALSDAKILAMSKTALGNLTAATGQTLTISRTSASSCMNLANSEMTLLPANKMCIRGGGIDVPPSAVHRTTRSEEWDAADWTKISDGVTAVPVVTANTTDVTDPLGGNTAEKVVFPAVSGATDYSILRQTFTGTAAAWSGQLMCRTLSGTVTLYTGFSISTPTYYSAACTCTTTWQPCLLENKTLTVATWNRDIGVNRNDPGQAAQTGGTVYLSAEMSEAGQFATNYIPTTSVAVTRANDIVRHAADPGINLSEGCFSVTLTPYVTGSPLAPQYYLSFTSGAASAIGYTNSLANYQAVDPGVHSPLVAHAFVAGTAKNYKTTWSVAANQFTVFNLTAGTSNTTAFTAFTGPVTSVNIGAANTVGGNSARLRLSNIKINTTATGCAQ